MRTLVLTDIHGNLPALEAILAHPAARGCGEIVSLGDQVNFGPQSREVHERLRSLGAVMLLGNHEERLLHPGDFAGYNWRLMRWTAERMRGADLRLPTDLRRGGVLFTHGTPGEPYHLVQPEGVPALIASLPPGVHLLLSGHNHTPWDVEIGGVRAINPGSAGMRELPPGAAESGEGGWAPFLTLEDGRVTHHAARYCVQDVARAYVETGAYREAPELTRAVLAVMQTARAQGALKLIQHVSAVAEGLGLTLGDEAAWRAADRSFDWAEDMSTEEYWEELRRAL